MTVSPKFLILAGLVAAVLFAALIVFSPKFFLPQRGGHATTGAGGNANQGGVPLNAFLPRQIQTPRGAGNSSVNSPTPESGSPTAGGEKFQANFPSLDQLKAAVSSSLFQATSLARRSERALAPVAPAPGRRQRDFH